MERLKVKPWVTSTRTALICIAALLTGIGLLSIYASSSIPAAQVTGNEFAYVQKQAIVALVGFFLIFVVGHLPFVWIERATLPLLVASFMLMFLVFIPGFEGHAKGASRWILLFGFTIQPAEIAKLAVVMFLAKNLSRKNSNPDDFTYGVLPNLVVTGLFCALLMLQPDFGSTALLLVLCFLMLFVAGLPLRFTALFLGGGLALFVAAIVAAPYRMARLLIFLDPWSQVRTGGFQIIQSYLGFQNGGIWGAGLGESRQKLFFLPEAHTDFILAVIGEELGLFGVILICLCFAYLIFLGFQVSLAQQFTYRKFLGFGLTMLIALQAFINIGVTMGVLPTKGMTLPLVSNGANSLIIFLVVIAILARMSQEIPNQTVSRAEI